MLKTLSALAILAFGLGALTLRAQVTAPRPGVMTESRVWIQNRGSNEAVPVAIEQAGTLTVRVADNSTVALAPGSTVQAGRQRWAYRTVHVAMGQDAAAALVLAGAEGWEAVGVTATDDSGTTILLKQPQ